MSNPSAETFANKPQAQPSISTMKSLSLIESALTIPQILAQRELVLSVMKEAMKENQHYGKIPGCGDKPTLLQGGAQLMCATFRLSPSYMIVEEIPSEGHRAFRVICQLKSGDNVIADGIGYCSSMESKYRYRNAAATIEDTGEPLPGYYWKLKDSDGIKAASERLSADYDGAKVGPKKYPDGWRVVRYIGGGDGKVENPNPTDMFNTVLKMAKKRAFVDATITATACNDLFTQDLEDIRANLDAVEVHEPEPKKEPEQAKMPEPIQWLGVQITELEPLAENAWMIHFGEKKAGTRDKAMWMSCGVKKEAGKTVDVTVKTGRVAGSFEIVDVEYVPM